VERVLTRVLRYDHFEFEEEEEKEDEDEAFRLSTLQPSNHQSKRGFRAAHTKE